MRFRSFLIAALSLTAAVVSSQEESVSNVTILIAYDSRSGNTEAFAKAIAEGVGTVAGASAVVRSQAEVAADEITRADGVLVGTPVHWGNLSSETKAFLDRIGDALAAAGEVGADSTAGNRTGGAFVTGGSVASGKDVARMSVLVSLMSLKFVLIGGEDGGGFGTLGPQATTGPSDPGLSGAELDEARGYGARFAALTKRFER